MKGSPSFDTDACVPFLLSQIGQEEISEITSPCFGVSPPQPTIGGGGSLFERLSRGLSSEKTKEATHDARLPGQSTPDVNGLSTIEDQIDRAEEDGKASQHRQRWNGQCQSPHLERHQTPAGQEAHAQSSKSPEQKAAHISHKAQRASSLSPLPSERLPPRSPIKAERNLETAESVSRQVANTREKTPRFSRHNSSHDRSVSWEISPSEGPQHVSLTTQLTLDAQSRSGTVGRAQRPDSSHEVDTSALTAASKHSGRTTRDGSSHSVDTWRQVVDPESGRTYYYNRRTRVSRWRLPKGAVLAKKSSRRTDCSRSSSRDESKRRPQISFSSEETRPKNQSASVALSPTSPARTQEAIIQGPTSALSGVSQPQTPHYRAVQEQSFISHDECKSGLEDETFHSHQFSPRQQGQRQEMSKSTEGSQLRLSQPSPIGYEECKSGSFLEETFDSTPNAAVVNATAVSESYLTEETFCSSPNEHAASEDDDDAYHHIKSPQDCTACVVFCPYCSQRHTAVALLASHLAQCPQFKEMQLHGLSTQIELESILFRAWSTIGGNSKPANTGEGTLSFAVEPKNVSLSLDSLNAKSLGASYDAISEEDIHHRGVALKTPNPRKTRREAHTSAPPCIEERKNCPFCEERFLKGNAFSAHLLKCSERRRARKERRAKKGTIPDASDRRKCITPGRRMPWE